MMMASSNSKRSQSRAQSASLSDTENDSGPNIAEKKHKRRKRDANVFDAVAGRVTTTLPLEDASDSDEEATTATPYRQGQAGRLRDPTLAPEEVLFRRIKAPIRFAEKDIYHAHEALPRGGRDVLPDSDMLKAIHGYASHFYAALGAAAARGPGAAADGGGGGGGGGAAAAESNSNHNNIDIQSMDETALVAFGILLEEAARDTLGKRGDLVFTEGQKTVGQELSRDVIVGLLDADSLPRAKSSANSSGKGRVE